MATRTKKQSLPERAPSTIKARGSAGQSLSERARWLAFVLVVSALAYARSLGGGWLYDDHGMILENHEIKKWSFFWKAFTHDSWWYRGNGIDPESAYYRPLQLVWFGLNYRLFGFHALGWHVTLVALQVAVVWLVFRLAEEFTEGDLSAAVIAGLAFGLMPIHAQAVSWISAVPFPLITVFELAALLALTRRGQLSTRRTGAALALFVCALLSHESAAVFPAVILAYELIVRVPDSSATPTWQSRIISAVRVSAPFFGLLALYLVLRLVVLGRVNEVSREHLPFTSAILTLPWIVGRYFVILLAPFRPEPAHYVVPVDSVLSWRFWLPTFGLPALAIAVYFLVRRTRRVRIYLFCAAWLALVLLPVLNILAFRPAALVEDRYLYESSAAWCILLGSLAAEIIANYRSARTYVLAAIAATAATFAITLWIGQQYFRDDFAMFSRCVAEAPRSWLCHEWLGRALMNQGEFVEADDEYSKAVAINPEPQNAEYDRGMIHYDEGDRRAGLFEMLNALRAAKEFNANQYADLLRVSVDSGNEDIARKVIELAERYPSTRAAAGIGKAKLELAHDNKDAALQILKATTAKYPDDGDAWILIADTESDLGHLPEATAAAKQAVESAPDAEWFHMVYAKLLDRSGHHDQAVEEYRKALSLAPENQQLVQTVQREAPEAMH